MTVGSTSSGVSADGVSYFRGTPLRDLSRHLLAGGMSAVIAKTVEYPLDVLKVVMQVMPAKPGTNPMLQAAKSTYANKGILGFYAGLTFPIYGAIIENSTLFFVYNDLKYLFNVPENLHKSEPLPALKYGLCGAISGVWSACVLTPVELIKCKLQVQGVVNTGAQKYKGPIDAARHIVRTGGIGALFNGLQSCIMREVPGNVAWFGTYEIVKRQVQVRLDYEYMSDVPLLYTAFCGSCAGVAYWGLPFPADTVKSRIQTEPRFSNKSFLSVLTTVVKEEGVSSLYRGVGITCARAIPSHALIFYVYEAGNKWLRNL